jgi:hypothetical protein
LRDKSYDIGATHNNFYLRKITYVLRILMNKLRLRSSVFVGTRSQPTLYYSARSPILAGPASERVKQLTVSATFVRDVL